MESNISATLQASRGTSLARSPLVFGVLAGPFYLVVGLSQALTRDGFDLMRHALSVLANGPGGWVQTANFILTGLMVLAAAVGIRRALGPTSRALPWSLGVFGVSMLVAAAFPADPMDGFPVGTPAGPPTSISTTGFVHFVAGALGFTALAVSCFAAAVTMSRRRATAIARVSLVCGLAVALGFFGGAAFANISAGIMGIWVAVVVGWAWLAVISLHLSRR